MKNKKWIFSLFLTLCLALGLCGTALAVEETGGFLDVPDDAWYADAVAYVRDFYLSLRAAPLDQWTTYRLTGETLKELANE